MHLAADDGARLLAQAAADDRDVPRDDRRGARDEIAAEDRHIPIRAARDLGAASEGGDVPADAPAHAGAPKDAASRGTRLRRSMALKRGAIAGDDAANRHGSRLAARSPSCVRPASTTASPGRTSSASTSSGRRRRVAPGSTAGRRRTGGGSCS